MQASAARLISIALAQSIWRKFSLPLQKNKTGTLSRGGGSDSIDIIDSIAIIALMASMTIRNLPDETKRLIRVRAAENGRSMEEEVRERLIRDYKPNERPEKVGSWVRDIVASFQEMGGIDLEPPPREPMRDPIDFSGPEFGK
jgi:antitoxin FitA